MVERILVGWDPSEFSDIALEYAVSLAKLEDVDAVTVVYSPEKRDKKFKDMNVNEILKMAKNFGKDKDVKIETRLLWGKEDPDVEIVKFAEENDYNHIIVGHKGRTGLDRIILGSTAIGVVEKAHCAVTVVRGICPIDE